jgi:hypothetical protein
VQQRPSSDGHASLRTPLVLIAPSYGNQATRLRFANTLAVLVDFVAAEGLRPPPTDEEVNHLHALHPDPVARRWGALPGHDTSSTGCVSQLQPLIAQPPAKSRLAMPL